MEPKNDMKNSYPGSEKIYIPGKLHNIRVGMRKVNLTDTVKIINGERVVRHNDPVYVYDTSGAYTDPEIKIDYIHGSDEVFRLGEKDSGTGILLPPIAKDSFFSTISKGGPLPRKSFSMGEASEKRFYLEARKLFKD